MTRACVIGAGFSGLAAAITLQHAGIETTLIEARDRPGGQSYGWERAGFRFEGGPDRLGDPASVSELWQLTGQTLADHIELLPLEPHRRLSWTDGTILDLPGEVAAWRSEIARSAPADASGYEEFLRWSAQAARDAGMAQPQHDSGSLLSLAAAAPRYLRHQGWRTAYGLVAHFIKDQKLREALTVQLLMQGANPLKASSFQVLSHRQETLHAALWPEGGMSHLADMLAAQFRRMGGSLLFHDPALHVHTLGNSASEVECLSGWRQRFDGIVSSADVVHTYRDLLSGSQRAAELARKLVRQRFTPGVFAVHFGLEGSWPGIPHHTVLFGPRFKGLIEDVFDHGVLPRDQVIFLNHPSVTDPSLAPPGKSSFRALIPVANQARLPIDWDQAGPLIEQRILEEVGRRLIPDIDDRIVTKSHYAPRDLSLDLNAWSGSAFGLEPAGAFSLPFQLPLRDPGIRNFYCLNAAAQPGSGVAGKIASAMAAAKHILANLREGNA